MRLEDEGSCVVECGDRKRRQGHRGRKLLRPPIVDRDDAAGF